MLWFAAVAIPQQFGDEAGFAWLWWAPTAYLSAWLVLASPSLPGAVLGSVALAAACAVLIPVGFLMGLFTFPFVIGPPAAIIGCAFVLGRITALVHAAVTPVGDLGAWRRIHGLGGLFAGVGLFVSLLYARSPVLPAGTAWDVKRIILFGAIVGLGFLWHAVESYRRLRAEHVAVAPVCRVFGLLVVAYLAPAAAFWWANPDRAALAWPVDFRKAVAAREAAEAAKWDFWGTRDGAVLPPGARATLLIGADRLTLSAPAGWLARSSGSDRTFGAHWFILRPAPDAGSERPILSRLSVSGVSWSDAIVVHYAPRGEPAAEMRRHVYDCRAAEGRGAALSLCWKDDRRHAWEGLAPALGPAPGPGAVRVSIQPDYAMATMTAFATGFRAGCSAATSCTAEFGFAGMTAFADFRPEDLRRWPDLRREVDRLLRAATGRGLDDAAAFQQPEGDVLPFAAP